MSKLIKTDLFQLIVIPFHESLHRGFQRGSLTHSLTHSLIIELEKSGWRVFLYHRFYGSPMFADDLTVLSRLKSGLDQLLNCLNDYTTKWRIVFNIEKTVILTFGDRSQSATPARMWKFGSVSLQKTEVWKNLGKVWHSDINYKLSVQNSVQKGFEAISRMARLCYRSSALNSKISAQLWKSIALPHMLYG